MADITAENVRTKVEEEEQKLFLEQPQSKETNNNLPKTDAATVKKLPPDGGYGWVVLAASFSISVLLDGIMYSFGILQQGIKDYYIISNKEANMLTSLYTGFFLLSGPLVSGIVNQFGCRVAIISGAVVTSIMFGVSALSPHIFYMYVSLGVIGGVSTGIFYIASLLIIAEYFDKKKGVATGITMAGSGIGFFIGPPVMEYLIKNYGWKVTIVACASLILVNAFIGILSKPLNPPKSQIKFGKKKKREVEVVNVEIMSGSIISFKALQTEEKAKESMIVGLLMEMVNVKLLGQNWRFLFITLSNLFVFTGYFLPFVFVTKVAEINGIDRPSLVISVIGIVNIPSRVMFGYLADARFLSPVTLNTMSVLLGAFPLIAYEHYLQHQFWSQCIFAVFYAMATSGLVCLATPYLCDIVGLDKLPNAMGIVSLFRGVGCFVGPFIGGIIADQYSMAMAFYFCAACYLVGFVFSAIVSFSPVKKTDIEMKEIQAS